MKHSWLQAAFIVSVASSQATFNRGINYFRLGKITDLSYDSLTQKYTATVDGSFLYDCEVTINGEEEIDFQCDCEAALTYSGACKHIVAMLFAIKEQQKEIETIQTSPIKSRSSMLYAFKQSSAEENPLPFSETKELAVHYELVFSTNYHHSMIDKVELKLKVGNKRMYVVREIDEFIHSWIDKKAYTFTPNFTFDPKDHHFNEQDSAVFELLYTHLEIQATKQHQSFYYRQNQTRTLEIPAITFHSLLDLLNGANLSYLLSNDHQINHVTIKPLGSDRLLHFSLEESRNRHGLIQLASSNIEQFVFAEEAFQILIEGNTIYSLTTTQAKELEMIGEHTTSNETLDLIPKEELEAFCSYVLPTLSSIGQVTLQDTLHKSIEKRPLQAKLFLDIDNGTLYARLSFEYGEHIRNPFYESEEKATTKIITRDVRKEEQILHVLKRTNFTINEGQLTLSDWETIIPFMFEELPLLQKQLDVYTTSAVKKVIAIPPTTPSVQLDVNNETNWLDVSFSIEGIPEADIMNVLQALQSGMKYYKLSSGAYLQLNHERFDSMKKVIKTVTTTKRSLDKDMAIPLHKAFELEKATSSTRISKRLHQLLSDVQQPEFSDWPMPKDFHAELRDYQVNGYRWLRTLNLVGLSGILADDMGLGKTVQTIAFLQAEIEVRPTFQAMIVAPASLIYNWEKEIRKFAPALKTIVLAGTKQTREQLFQGNIKETDVFITSYPLLQRDYKNYENHLFQTIILDEAQAIKNDATKTTKSVRSLQAGSCFALSGTPIENHQDELFSIFHSLLPGMLGTKKQFKDLENTVIKKRVRPFILRRLKKDVLSELPEKIETVQYTDLSKDQKKMYLAQVKQLTEDVNDAIVTNQFQQKRIEILAGLTRLRQICCHPNLINHEDKYESGKLNRLLEYVEEGIQAGQRIVIFSQFTSMLQLIKEAFLNKEWTYHYLDGQTPAKQRVEMAEQFNNGEKPLFLVSLKAGGTGLNLIGGDTVILYDTWWNPAIEEQAADRVYRYGQTKTVQVIKLIANGTIEEKILDLHDRKKALVDAIIQPGEESLQALSAEDIKQLLTFS
ncbi:DEAD/DEAH box helicase [Halalkalibacter krulwichiae]|uniref:ATP-dependent helicase HepA n=1 Tax=Halalkalibacter krulwichiae TaxID=199441 RepID=A0A1X9M9Y7_9BACI|nr:DEAD/DEAH box helicase [Halalkalibacter krulwichiae]ARK30216.1 ATP-dependent helicase HepA [Halalkalibacter krulwichiae]